MSKHFNALKHAIKWLHLKTNLDKRVFSKAHGIVILCYHSIPESGDWFYDTPSADFEQHIIYLKKRFQIVKVVDLFMLDESTLRNSLLLAITFDDGYEDNYTNALPILRKHNVPATVFLPASNLDGIESRIVTPEKNMGKKVMTWKQVKQMSRHTLIDIGSYGCRHINMTKLSQDEFMCELSESKNVIQSHTGREPVLFAYPGGFHDKSTKSFLEGSGYIGAFTSEQIINQAPIDKYEIGRIAVTRNHRAVASLAYLLAHILSSH